jgi:tetraacyldisaccharide 4'-kinase
MVDTMSPVSENKASRKMKYDKLWYGKSPGAIVLLPLSWLFRIIVLFRRLAYKTGIFKIHRLPVPVIVVGNITVGGTGKTPLVIYLANYLKEQGYKPGIISRGYGGQARTWPQQVRLDGDPTIVGDEAIMIARRSNCPMAVSPKRADAGKALLEHNDCDIIVSDDGMQHYALGRDIEIAVIDGVRRFGNKQCLPAGPLREPISRLNSVDLKVVNGLAGSGEWAMRLSGDICDNLHDPGKTMMLKQLWGKQVHAVAGVGNPRRFFDKLSQQGIKVIEHPFPDHHAYVPEDISFDDEIPVLMTEKDAVKCKRFATSNHWYLPVSAVFDDSFNRQLNSLLKKVRNG